MCSRLHVHETQKVYDDWTHIKHSHNGGLLSEHSNLPRLSRAVHRYQMAASDLASSGFDCTIFRGALRFPTSNLRRTDRPGPTTPCRIRLMSCSCKMRVDPRGFGVDSAAFVQASFINPQLSPRCAIGNKRAS